MTERELQENVLSLAKALSYLSYHTHDSRRSQPGFPDLVLAKPGRLIFIELKTAKGKLTAAQTIWLAALTDAGAEAYVFRPLDWLDGSITRTLR